MSVTLQPICQNELPILYIDQDLILVNKPSGLLSVPGRDPQHYDSVYSRLLNHYDEIHVVHRLDMDTSGVMVMARHKEALRHLLMLNTPLTAIMPKNLASI